MAGSLLIVLRGGWSRLTPFQYCELLRGLLITVVSYMVLMIDMSQAYHTVRNQAMIKLYAAPHAQEGRPPWLAHLGWATLAGPELRSSSSSSAPPPPAPPPPQGIAGGSGWLARTARRSQRLGHRAPRSLP